MCGCLVWEVGHVIERAAEWSGFLQWDKGLPVMEIIQTLLVFVVLQALYVTDSVTV